MADRPVLQISREWRIAEDGLQWMLQRCSNAKRHADNRDDARNWCGRAFCRTRKALLRCMGEYVKLEADEDPGLIEAAVARVQRFPEMHVARPEPLAGVAVERKIEGEPAERQVAGAA